MAQAALGLKPFRPVQRASVVEEVIDQLKGLMQERHFGPGSRLPSERELAEHLGVSRPSVREALRTLAFMGVLDTRHGSPTRLSNSSNNVLRKSFELLMALEEPSIFDLYDLSELLDIYSAERAAQRRTESDLAEIEAALESMRANPNDPEARYAANDRFHDAITVAAHNPVAYPLRLCLYDAARPFLQRASRQTLQAIVLPYEIHAPIFHAIRKQDSKAARRAMTRHMHLAREALDHVVAETEKGPRKTNTREQEQRG